LIFYTEWNDGVTIFFQYRFDIEHIPLGPARYEIPVVYKDNFHSMNIKTGGLLRDLYKQFLLLKAN